MALLRTPQHARPDPSIARRTALLVTLRVGMGLPTQVGRFLAASMTVPLYRVSWSITTGLLSPGQLCGTGRQTPTSLQRPYTC